MTENEFHSVFHGVNCPKYRGAQQPPFDKYAINESQFSDELRFKSFNTQFIEGNNTTQDTIKVEWESQEWDYHGIDGVVDEIKRCFKECGFRGIVELSIWERGEKGGDCDTWREFEIT